MFDFSRIGIMSNQFAILVADRNRNVREFLRREFEADGYFVQLAKDELELLHFLESDAEPDLLILDLDMPIYGGPVLMDKLLDRRPRLPVVIHTLLTEDLGHQAVKRAAAFLEKRGNNIDHLKTVVIGVLRKCYPNRFLGLDAVSGRELGAE
jgi:CheY-like chemotaxis protein